VPSICVLTLTAIHAIFPLMCRVYSSAMRFYRQEKWTIRTCLKQGQSHHVSTICMTLFLLYFCRVKFILTFHAQLPICARQQKHLWWMVSEFLVSLFPARQIEFYKSNKFSFVILFLPAPKTNYVAIKNCSDRLSVCCHCIELLNLCRLVSVVRFMTEEVRSFA